MIMYSKSNTIYEKHKITLFLLSYEYPCVSITPPYSQWR